ncbi:Histidinol-phosphate aminotransferase [Methylophaga frappieri]|uniref:Histidinol-phosphate aminotransferase n=1 Tax=Methylophaga frappieri (strain ATCC BAA-2434 / DSM 25690 / JAM7) TaxID=754477 RepID=I1YIP2_METFJ|nr:Histidinol-phosphate aminotransferase [Methylophaga frappieri]
MPGEQPRGHNLVKLNTNENPFGPSPKVIEAIRHAADDRLRLYPVPDGGLLRQTIADYHDVEIKHVFVGNGSDEVLAHVFHGLFKHDLPIFFPDITYSFYPVYCQLYDIDYRQIPLAGDFSLKVSDYLQPNGGIIFPNPNAPTGRPLSVSEIDVLLQKNTGSVVVIDEAYVDFGGESAVQLTKHYPNLLVTQTLSKSRSLAGMRIGFAIGDAALIEALVRVKDSFNSYPLDSLAIAAGVAAFEDEAYFASCQQKVIAAREDVTQAMQALGFDVLPSAANFVFARHADYDAAKLAQALREAGIIVRHFKKPRIEQFLRITIGTTEQNRLLLAELARLL